LLSHQTEDTLPAKWPELNTVPLRRKDPPVVKAGFLPPTLANLSLLSPIMTNVMCIGHADLCRRLLSIRQRFDHHLHLHFCSAVTEKFVRRHGIRSIGKATAQYLPFVRRTMGKIVQNDLVLPTGNKSGKANVN
jgi:hypothetical protein